MVIVIVPRERFFPSMSVQYVAIDDYRDETANRLRLCDERWPNHVFLAESCHASKVTVLFFGVSLHVSFAWPTATTSTKRILMK